jgi:HlyD family secretion protein
MTAAQKRRLGIIGMVAVIGALLLVALAGREPVPEVTTAQVLRETITATITSNGKVEAVTPHIIRAQLNTFVQRVAATEGQAVRRGEPLLELDSAEAAAEVARLRDELAAAEEEIRTGRRGGPAEALAQLDADWRKAEAEVKRLEGEYGAFQRLLAKQAATQLEVDNAKLALDRARDTLRVLEEKKAEYSRQAKLSLERGSLQAERARAALAAAQEKLRSARVVAPESGTLYALPVREGQYMRVGDLLAELADLRRVRVRAFVDEPELGSLAEGQEVEITWDAFPGRVWKGRTEQLPKAVVSRGTRSVGEVLCSVENEKLELLPNVNVNVFIRARSRGGALVVPRAAVHVNGTERYVYLVEGDRLKKRPVRVGIASATKYEIVEGLAERDRVALPGAVELHDAMTVRVVAPQ